MAVREILSMPDPSLKKVAGRIAQFDSSIERLIGDLLDTLGSTGGIGLSATQINDCRRALVIAPTHDRNAQRIYINPAIQSRAAWALVEESCLSVPNVSGSVFRATKIDVVAQDQQGDVFNCTLEGMDAVCLQHEIDHLDGILFTDRLPFFEKLRLRLTSVIGRGRRTGTQAPGHSAS